MTEKIKITQKDFNDLYEIDNPEAIKSYDKSLALENSNDKTKDKDETVLNEEEQHFDDEIVDMEEWGTQS